MLELGRYALVRQIGRGGMAEIWKAKASGPSGFVKFLALKMILPEIADDRLFVQMFVDEAKLAASLVHPNLVSVFDFGEIDGKLFLAMEYVAGTNLDRLIHRLSREDATLSVDVALYIALEACRGLGHAHAHAYDGVVHRDVSPQNVLISASGDVKISDFGIAKAASAISRTAAGQVRGKIAYMSPEQLDNRALDGRSDLFSLGIVLYEMLTGDRLFRGKSSEEVSERVRKFDPTADLDFERVPVAIRPTLVVLLQPDREHRQRDAEVLEAELAEHLDLASVSRARHELAALVARLFPDELASDARDDHADDPLPSDTLAHALGAAPMVTKLELPTGSRPRTAPRHAEGSGKAHEVAAAAVAPRSRGPRIAAALLAVAVVGGAAAYGARHYLHGAAHAGPVRGGVLRVAIAFEAENNDVFSSELSRTRIAIDEVVEPFVRIDRDGAIEPWTIERSELSADRRALTLHLRDGLMFHDHPCFAEGHGRTATAADVVFSLREAVRNGRIELPIAGAAEFRAGAPAVAGVSASGPLDVVVQLTAAAPFYASELANVRLLPHELDGCEDLHAMKQPVGTGPFRFAAPVHGTRLELVRAPSYWHHADNGDQLPYLDGISIVPLDDLREVMSRLIHGELDLAMPADDAWSELVDLSADHVAIATRYAGLGVDAATTTTRRGIALLQLLVGPHSAALGDAHVRHALALALDRPALVAVAERPQGGPNGRFLDPRMVGYDPTLAALGFDPAAARAELAASATPHPPTIVLGAIREQPMAALVVKQAAAIGLDVRLRTIAQARAMEALTSGEVDAMLVTDNYTLIEGENAGVVGESDRFGLSAKVAELQLALAAAPERTDRAPIYTRIERALLADAPIIPIAWGDVRRPLELYIVRNDLRDFHDRVTGSARREDLAHAWLDR